MSVLLATFEKQCASTWRWIRSWALRLEGDDDGNAENEAGAEQPSIRISHSLPDLSLDPKKIESDYPTDSKEGRKVRNEIRSRLNSVV